MAARFFWPGWAAFTDPRDSTSTVGVRYRTLTVNTYWQGNHPDGSISFVLVTASISCDATNGSFISDTFTESALPTLDSSDGTDWQLGGINGIGNPDNVVTETKLSLPSFTAFGVTYPEISLVLSDPVTLADCKAKAAILMTASGGVASLSPGDLKEATYLQGPDTRMPNTSLDTYMQPSTATAYDTGTATYVTGYCWASLGVWNPGTGFADGADITIVFDTGVGDYVWSAFSHNSTVVSLSDVSGATAAIQDYIQTGYWYIAQAKWFGVTLDACVTDSFADTASAGVFTDIACAMQSPSGGNLTLLPPDLTADTSQSSATTTRTPQFGYFLTSGGCPCQCGVFTWSVHNSTGSSGTWYLTFSDGGTFWGSGSMSPGTYALAAGATDGPHSQTFDCIHPVTVQLRTTSPTGTIIATHTFDGLNDSTPFTFTI